MFNAPLLLGLAPEDHPHLFERVAIEATNTLKSSEVGIRALKNRSFLRRVYEGTSSDGQKREASTFDQLRRANVATVQIVSTLMKEERRTRVCVQRVTDNLLDVNRDLDILIQRSGDLELAVRRQREELVALIREETNTLEIDIRRLEVEINRHKVADRLRLRFERGELYQGVGPLIAGALYLAGSVWLHHGTPDYEDEFSDAKSDVLRSMPQKALGTEETILQATLEISDEMLEPMDFLASTVPGPGMQVMQRLIQRRRANLTVNENVVREELSIVRALSDPQARLERGFVKPDTFMKILAEDLCSDLEGASHA